MEEDICELLWAEIPLKNSGSYFLGVFYRPPSSDMNYLEGLKRSLETVTVVSDHTKIVLLGDFNFPDIDWDLICPSQPNVSSDYFCDKIVNFYGFSQLIDEPTRQDAILDLVISNRPESIKNIQILDGIGSSDHNIVTLKLTSSTRPYKWPKQIFDYKNSNWDNFRLELSNIPWDAILNDNDTMEEVWLNWKSAFLKAVENNVPSKKIKSRQNVPWIVDVDWNKYKSLRNKVKSELNKSYYQHVHSLIDSKNPKRFWSFIKSKAKSKSIPVTMNWSDRDVTASELFCKFFASVFTRPDPATDVDEGAHLHGSGFDIPDLICSSANVGELLLTLDVNKAIGPDGLSARLLREAAPVISDPLSKLFNMSLNRGKLPRDWKRANIAPVYKNGGKEYVSNYRPISLTSLVVKTLEKLVTRHIMAHLEDHDLLSPH